MSSEKIIVWLETKPRQWNKRFHEFMVKIKFVRSSFGSCVYMREEWGSHMTFLLLYLDDILIASKDKEAIQTLKNTTEF